MGRICLLYTSNHYVGKELGEIWGLTTEGFFQNEEELANHADQTKVDEDDMGYKFYVGDLKFKDIMSPMVAMNVNVELKAGVGPVFSLSLIHIWTRTVTKFVPPFGQTTIIM